MIIKAHIKNYELFIEKDVAFFSKLILPEGFYVVDKNVMEYHAELLKHIPSDRLYVLEATEENKTIETVLDLCEKMMNLPFKRNIALVSIGGGIIQDITGFVANVLYRGIKWIFVPTTLLAACDSCIGGKTSLNYKSYKNLLGTFYPPDKIYVASMFFHTLSEKDFMSGLGEVVKFNVMNGLTGFEKIERNIDALLNRDESIINEFMENSLLFKKTFIEEDEFDTGRRKLLNFAHTFGHAFEVTSAYNIPHGTAVALGMIVANRISLNRKMLELDYVASIEKLVHKIVKISLKKEWFLCERIVSIIQKDKKRTGSALTAVLMDKSFTLEIYNDLNETEIRQALTYLNPFIG